MQTLIDILYCHAQEDRALRYLQTPEYRQTTRGLEEAWDELRSDLTAEQLQRLDKLLSRETKVCYLEDQALFLAGISIGLDLGRL